MPRRIAVLLLNLGPAASQAEPSWTEHVRLSTLIPMVAVSDREMAEALNTNSFFSRVNTPGYHCTTSDFALRKIRQVTITCLRGEDKIVYEGGPQGTAPSPC